MGDAYTLGVRITGDTQSLRAELAQANALIAQFANTSVAAMQQAAAALNSSAQTMQNAVSRQSRTLASSAQQVTSTQDQVTRRWVADQQQMAQATEEAASRSNNATASLSGNLARLTGYAGFGLLLKQIWDTGIGFNEFKQNSQVALTSMLGSERAATDFLADVLAFAHQTPFAFTDLTEASQNLIAMGVNGSKVIPILRAVGDAAESQSQGIDRVRQLADVFGQIQSLGKISGDQIRTLSLAGVPALQILANQAGMTTSEFQDLVSKGLISADVAIDGLVTGINQGTTGINGQTQALGGLMEKIKGSGGITATIDSTRTSFRDLSGELTESLVPVYVSFLHVMQDGMGTIQRAAQAFGDLPGPVQQSALAFLASAAAAHFIGPALQSTGSGFITATRAAYGYRLESELANGTTSRLRLQLAGLSTAAKTTGSSIASGILGAFGGPVGLAITGITTAIAAYTASQAEAAAAIQEVAGTIDAQTGAVTENTREWVKNKLAQQQGGHLPFGLDTRDSGYNAATKLGLGLDTMTDAALGSVDALQKVQAVLQVDPGRIPALAKAAGLSTQEYLSAMRDVETAVSGTSGTIDEAIRISQQKAEADKNVKKTTDDVTGAVQAQGTQVQSILSRWNTWTDDQLANVQKMADTARQLANPDVGKFDLDLATDKDVADARDRVTDATRRLRDAEADREETFARKKVSANDKVKAEEAVADARKALNEATQKLADTETKTDPVKAYHDKVQGILDATKTFVSDIQTLADKGLNAQDLQSIIQAGPEASADVRKALLTDTSQIDFTNEARKTLDQYGTTLSQQASTTQAAIEAGQTFYDQLGLGMQIAAQEGSADTIAQIATNLATNPGAIYAAGNTLGLSFLQGLADASALNQRMPSKGGPNRAYAAGGIYPGYTPGTDIGMIAVSGGEAIMRPEFTRGVGAAWIHHMNAVARTLGSAGVRRELGYLGGFANGGTVPQVVTVPVNVTNERHTPWTIQRAYFTDPKSAAGWGDRQRAQDNLFGG